MGIKNSTQRSLFRQMKTVVVRNGCIKRGRNLRRRNQRERNQREKKGARNAEGLVKTRAKLVVGDQAHERTESLKSSTDHRIAILVTVVRIV